MLERGKYCKHIDTGCHKEFIITITVKNKLLYIDREIYDRYKKNCKCKNNHKKLLYITRYFIREFAEENNMEIIEVEKIIDNTLFSSQLKYYEKRYYITRDKKEQQISKKEFETGKTD